MAQTDLNISADELNRNLDTVLQKLQKIASMISQINSNPLTGGIPSQFSGNGGYAPGGGNNYSPSASVAGNMGMNGGGMSLGHMDNPSILGSMMLSNAMRGGGVGGGGMSSPAASYDPFSPSAMAPADGMNIHTAATATWMKAMGGGNPYARSAGQTTLGDAGLFVSGVQSYNNSAQAVYDGAQGNATTDAMLRNYQMPGLLADDAARQSRYAALQSTRFALGGVLASGFSGLANSYAQSTISGSQDQEGYGRVYGGVIGGLAGVGIAAMIASGAAAGSVAPGPGTLIGAGIGAVVGSATWAAAQSPFVARNKTENALATFGAASGMSIGGLADSASHIANDYDSTNASRDQGFFSGYLGRAFHLYTGTDQASQQQVAGVMGALGGAYLNSGADPGGGRLQRLTRRIFDSTGNAEEAEKVAQSYARAAGNINNAGGNITDLYRIAGADSTNTMLRLAGRGAEADQLNGAIAGIQTSAYNSTGAASIAQGLSSDYQATGFSGASTAGRSGSYRAMIAGLQSQVGSVDAEMSAISQAPGGINSNEYKAKSALKSELMKQIASESAQRAQGLGSDIQGGSAVGLTNLATQSTTASLYGGAGDIRSAASATMGQLSAEASQLRGVTGLSYSDQLAVNKRIADIGLQQAALPAQAAGAAMRRSLLPLDVASGQQGLAYQGAGLYGSDSDLGNTALSSINGQQAIIDQARRSLNDPALSVEDRAAANRTITSAGGAMLQIRAGSRDQLLNRIEGRAGVVNSDSNNNLNRALSLGSGMDVRNAAIGAIGSLDAESASLGAQLKAGGLTAEQEIRLKGRQSQLAGQRFSLFQSSIDAAYAKDDLGYETQHTRLEGAMERQQYLPFSASNPMRLSIQSLNLNKGQLDTLNQREADLKRTGNLSPEREFELTRQRESLLTQNAEAIGQFSSGMENRLGALSAGAPSFFGRYTSYQLAALNLQQSGSPIRSFGAANGAHAKSQDDFIRAAGGDMHDVDPHSRTSNLNLGGATTDRLASVLEKLAGVLDRQTAGQGDGMRPGERSNMLSGSVSRQGNDTSGLYGSRN